MTLVLRVCALGEEKALERWPLVENELHHLARKYMRKQRPGQPLQTTELVNEVYLRLIEAAHVGWQDRTHFFRLGTYDAPRSHDFARSRSYAKRGRRAVRVTWEEALAASSELDWILSPWTTR